MFKKWIILGLTIILGASISALASSESIPDETISQLSSFMPDSYFSTNRYTQIEDSDQVNSNPWIDTVNQVEVARNENLILSIDENLLSIYVTQRSTGYVWSSTLFKDYATLNENGEPIYPDLTTNQDRGLRSNLWRNRIDSPVWLRYYTAGDSPQLRDETLFDSGLSTWNWASETDGFTANLYFSQAEIALSLEVTLTERGVRVVIPSESIDEQGDQRIGQLAIYPFFGAAKDNEIPGYFMVPDGTGALIRFDHDGFDTIFEKPFFGQDFSIDLPSDPTPGLESPKHLTAPVFGMVHGVDNQGFINVVHQGSTYGSLILYPGTITTDFNFGYINYIYRSSYRQPLNQSQTNTILRVQNDMNPVTVDQEWVFLEYEEANYVGMANAYQNILRQNMPLSLESPQGQSLHLDVLLSESEEAFIGRNTFVMTTVNELINQILFLQANGIDNIVVSLRGTSRNGYSGQSLQEFPPGNHVGSTADFERLFELVNVDVYLYIEPTKVYPFTRNATRYDVSVSRNLLTYRQEDFYGVFDRIHPQSMFEALTQIEDEALEFGFKGLMLDTIGHTFYASFGDDPYSRLAMQEDISRFIEARHAIINPYSHTFNASALFDVPLEQSLNQSFSDTVPFKTYALNGLKPLYSGYLNYSANMTLERLRMLDFHVFPSYFVTAESAYRLLDSPSKLFYTSSFSIWSEIIVNHESEIQQISQNIQGLAIESREALVRGVVLITYDNGAELLINYRSVSYEEDGWSVDPQSASLREGSS